MSPKISEIRSLLLPLFTGGYHFNGVNSSLHYIFFSDILVGICRTGVDNVRTIHREQSIC